MQLRRDDDLTLHGIACIPAGVAPHPLALVIPGSGPLDRDGAFPGSPARPYEALARGLADLGVATVRYDKRGVRDSPPPSDGISRFEHAVDDACAWVDALCSDPCFDGVTLIGHSEGALIALLAAAREPSVRCVVSLCGAATPVDATIVRQIDGIYGRGVANRVATALAAIGTGTCVAVDDDLASLLGPAVQPYLAGWMSWNPLCAMAALPVPVLVLHGECDTLVPLADAHALAAEAEASTFAIVPGMDHMLATADAQVAPELPLAIASFVRGPQLADQPLSSAPAVAAARRSSPSMVPVRMLQHMR